MQHWISLAPTALGSFMASVVEFVEALTIVLAVGIVRGWRSALLGAGAALAVLVALVALLGPSLARIPLPVVQVVVGTLLLMFGLRWLRKAVLRGAGVLALHDEAKAFAEETEALHRVGAAKGGGIDPLAFGASFKIVMLEGIEVVFIVVAIGAGGPLIVPAAVGAALALLVVVGLGFVLHRPLASIPENVLKFGVGVLLSAFGTFWVAEGLGLAWPGEDWAIAGLIGLYLAVAVASVSACVRLQRRGTETTSARPVQSAPALASGPFGAIARELLALFVDDVWLAAGVVVLVAAAGAARAIVLLPSAWTCLLLAAGLNVMLAASSWQRARA